MIEREGREIKILHCYREANCAADQLANLRITKKLGVVFFDSPHKKAMDVLNADIVGLIGPKMLINNNIFGA